MSHQVKIRQRHLETINTNQIDLVSIGTNPDEFRNKNKLSGKSIKRLAKKQRLYDRQARESITESLNKEPGVYCRPVID